ncbi:hypothetical protein [Microvirga massiliensis]|uniref:hypothetical protein n=1 Tax=Microvirga massiliensis TaxID=1033741 RepID=UPI00069B7DAD|nr:hypothetical protein [Microvirga massiliensis]
MTPILLDEVELVDAPTRTGERQFFEGIWAQSEAECDDEEGPNSRTLIDMRSKKTGPPFDQYENHCRITTVDGGPTGATLKLSCHEFWGDFEKKRDATLTSIRITPRSAQSIRIDGKPFVRCLR